MTTSAGKKSATVSSPDRQLSILIEINQAVSRSAELTEALRVTLQILEKSHHILSGAVFLIDEDGQTLETAASIGYGNLPNRTKYKMGEGLTGRIAVTGKPIIVSQVSKEPLFLNRMRSWDGDVEKEQSFIGVPIVLDYTTLGVLSVNLPYQPRRDYDSNLKFLTLVASALLQPIRLRQAIERERRSLIDENVMLKTKLQQEHSFHNIIGNSNEMREVYEKVTQVARANTTVLIRGESGTGKELIAQAIHYNSLRSDRPFIRVNCAAIPENLIESEFFGYEKGAFTGANASGKKGYFEAADNGIIFLDEVGELPLDMQAKLLRVIQDGEFFRVGGIKPVKSNVRILSATNRDLEESMDNKQFRRDLFYRLNVFPIRVPPLSERRGEIPALLRHFLGRYNEKFGICKGMEEEAIGYLSSCDWPGNIRQLENTLQRLMINAATDTITLVEAMRELHGDTLPPESLAEERTEGSELSLKGMLEQFEKGILSQAAQKYGSSRKAARGLGISQTQYIRKKNKYGLEVE